MLINEWSLKSISQTGERINQLLAFQKLVYGNESDVICVTESVRFWTGDIIFSGAIALGDWVEEC